MSAPRFGMQMLRSWTYRPEAGYGRSRSIVEFRTY